MLEKDLIGFEYDNSVLDENKEIRDEKDNFTFWHSRNDLIRSGLLTGEIDPLEEIVYNEPIVIEKTSIWKQLKMSL